MIAIEGYEKYYVTKTGNVVSTQKNKITILKPAINNAGYYTVSLHKNKTRHTKTVHRLIGKAFIPNPENKPQINHKNGIKNDNRIENLEWVTPLENMQHAISIGLYNNNTGENSTNAKITENNVREIRSFGSKMAQKEIAKMFNISRPHVSDIINRKRWRHVV